MAYSVGWLPGRRAALLVMAKTWGDVLPDKGPVWGIPATDITAQCREAFEVLVEKMRYIKARHFFSPPLTERYFAALLLNKPGASSSEIPAPVSQPTETNKFRVTYRDAYKRAGSSQFAVYPAEEGTLRLRGGEREPGVFLPEVRNGLRQEGFFRPGAQRDYPVNREYRGGRLPIVHGSLVIAHC
ncbi:MAG: hypothetical protein LBC51_05225 [Treponema sp.]|jgi:hypothetical protein|nr:hypothetical protein [Treponema sp.]